MKRLVPKFSSIAGIVPGYMVRELLFRVVVFAVGVLIAIAIHNAGIRNSSDMEIEEEMWFPEKYKLVGEAEEIRWDKPAFVIPLPEYQRRFSGLPSTTTIAVLLPDRDIYWITGVEGRNYAAIKRPPVFLSLILRDLDKVKLDEEGGKVSYSYKRNQTAYRMVGYIIPIVMAALGYFVPIAIGRFTIATGDYRIIPFLEPLSYILYERRRRKEGESQGKRS